MMKREESLILKEAIKEVMYALESCFIDESMKLAKVLDERKVGFGELFEIEKHIANNYNFPNITEELFERLEENLLYINLGE